MKKLVVCAAVLFGPRTVLQRTRRGTARNIPGRTYAHNRPTTKHLRHGNKLPSTKTGLDKIEAFHEVERVNS